MLNSLFPVQEWADYAINFVGENARFTEILVFALGFGESIALVSLFVPSTIIFLGIGAIHSAAGGEFWPVWLAGSAGACIGDIVSYSLGRYFKADAAKIWPMRKFAHLIPKGEAMFERWGFLSIILGKFVGGLRPFVPVVAGMFGMPLPIFVIASAVSSLIWAGVFLAPGYGITFMMSGE